LPSEFDIDNATGHRLDIIGNIVGIKRVVPFSLAKLFFGFDGDSTARGFDDLFQPVSSAPLKDLFEPDYTDTQLNDNDYRFFIKAKIAKNTVSAFMVSGQRISIQDVIQQLFDGKAYVLDNMNMRLALVLPFGFDTAVLSLVNALDLLPAGQGVGYGLFIASDVDGFGFSDDANALGFGDLSNLTMGGSLSELYFI
jgi:hypothetical protein